MKANQNLENIVVKNDNEKYTNIIIEKDINVGLNLISNNSVDLIVADPPYNISISEWDIFETEEAYFIFMKKWLLKSISKLKNNGSIYLFNNSKNSAKLLVFLEKCGLNIQNSIIWYKKDGFAPSKRKYVNNQETILFLTKGDNYIFNYEEIRVPYASKARIGAAAKNGILKNGKRWFPNENGKMCTDVWEFSSYRHQNKINGKTVKAMHPTIKPIAMIERIILASSNEGDIVLDLFSGSGTTSIAAKKLKRNSIAIENNKEYVAYINKRLDEYEY